MMMHYCALYAIHGQGDGIEDSKRGTIASIASAGATACPCPRLCLPPHSDKCDDD